MPHEPCRTRLRVDIVEESDLSKSGRMRAVQCYDLPAGWTAAEVHDLFLEKGLKPENEWLPAAEAVPPYWRQRKTG